MIDISVILTIQTDLNIEKTIESILHQNLDSIEIICINDGSTDNSLEILKKYNCMLCEDLNEVIEYLNK